jgi:hypothetical protein
MAARGAAARHCGISVADDVFANVVGGVRIGDGPIRADSRRAVELSEPGTPGDLIVFGEIV